MIDILSFECFPGEYCFDVTVLPMIAAKRLDTAPFCAGFCFFCTVGRAGRGRHGAKAQGKSKNGSKSHDGNMSQLCRVIENSF